MRISKKFASHFSRAAKKSAEKANYSFRLQLPSLHVDISAAFEILSMDGETMFDAKMDEKTCVQWFFDRFNLAQLREAKFIIAA